MPFLKYPGGKRHQAALISKLFADSGKRVYAEPFCGSAIVAEGIAADYHKLSDANGALVSTLAAAIDDPQGLIEQCEFVWEEFEGEDGYYAAREKFNSLRIVQGPGVPPLYVYLNKHGYNGLSRYNSRGEYNVPWGKRVAPIPAEDILAFSRALPGARVVEEDYKFTMAAADSDWFIYADPPYLGTFAGYSTVKFTEQDHADLNIMARGAADRGATVVVSSGRGMSAIFDVYRDASSAIMLENARSQIGQTPGSRGMMPEVVFVYERR